MNATVWVGRVKSECPVELLDAAFAKAGRVLRVETGFAGFAFVGFQSEEEADRAVELLHDTMIANVGKVLVQRATERGYQDACAKRDTFWQSKGRKVESFQLVRKARDWSQRSRSRNRSQPRRRRQSVSPATRRWQLQSCSREQPSVKRRKTRSSSQQSGGQQKKLTQRSRSNGSCVEAAGLSPPDRASVVCFFDGTSMPEIMLEGGSAVRVPQGSLPDVLRGFPFGFQGLELEDGVKLLSHLAAFANGEPTQDDCPECAVEVRHKIVVHADGGRVMHKVLSVGGQEVCAEEQRLTA